MQTEAVRRRARRARAAIQSSSAVVARAARAPPPPGTISVSIAPARVGEARRPGRACRPLDVRTAARVAATIRTP